VLHPLPPRHTHADGLPGPVDFLFAIPETQNSINVSWIPPVFTNTSDPLLLRYIILSHNTSNDLFSFDLAVETEVEPSANSDLVSTILTGLEVGTKYAVAIRAQSSAGNGSNPERYVIVSTYGRRELGSTVCVCVCVCARVCVCVRACAWLYSVCLRPFVPCHYPTRSPIKSSEPHCQSNPQ